MWSWVVCIARLCSPAPLHHTPGLDDDVPDQKGFQEEKSVTLTTLDSLLSPLVSEAPSSQVRGSTEPGTN